MFYMNAPASGSESQAMAAGNLWGHLCLVRTTHHLACTALAQYVLHSLQRCVSCRDVVAAVCVLASVCVLVHALAALAGMAFLCMWGVAVHCDTMLQHTVAAALCV